LTARVIVNRIWAENFGRPLVSTPSNFGKLGDRPTHPELLDDLAVRFMEAGWSLKWLQRAIVLSAAYRQSSEIDDTKQSIDPANVYLWRMNRRRLDVEQWRDAILAATGQLDRMVGGKSIDPANPNEHRRTVYARISRLDLNPMLALFDFPDPNAHNAKRSQTTTPLQKLFVLHSPFMVKQAQALAEQVSLRSDEPVEQAVTQLYQRVFGRQPTAAEVTLASKYLGDVSEERQSRWSALTQALL